MRKFILGLGIGFTVVFLTVSCKKEKKMRWKNLEHSELYLWKDGYFIQETVDASKVEQGIIRAKVDGKWGEYKIVDLPDEFVKWWVERRLRNLKMMREGRMPGWGDPHNAMVATYGIRRLDSQFKINNAVKGTGPLPKKETIKEMIKILKETKDSSMEYKFSVLENFYKNFDKYFTRKAIASLELYTSKNFETHSFLNEMVNPIYSMVYLDIPCFEIKGIVQLLHPDNPNLTDYERDIIEYVNLIHEYAHGEFKVKFITAIYWVCEVYNNSPRKGGLGKRITPSLP